MPFRVNIPPLTRVILVFLVGFSLVYQAASYSVRRTTHTSSRVVPWVALTPGISLFYPWVYLTSTLAEGNVLTLCIAAAMFFYGGKYLERAWGSKDFGKFLLVVTLIPNAIAAFVYALISYSFAPHDQVYTTIQGSVSVQAAFLVAFKQLVPEHTVTVLRGIIKVRVKHFPAMMLVGNTLSGIIFGTDTAAVLAWLGFFSSWTYLRFYKHQLDLTGTATGRSAIRGDASETFAFAYFWPDVVHGPVAALSDAVFDALVTLRICTPFSAEEVESSNQQASARGEGLPSLMNSGGRRGGGGKREEAERRRALALKALDQRLQAATSTRQVSTPPVSASAPPPGDGQPNMGATEEGDKVAG